MNIKNLSEGQIIKNYKELCELLEIKVVTSNSKKAQFKELERYISYDKEGNKFIIKEIYDNAKNKIDLRKEGLNSDLSLDIQILILDLLLQDINDGTLFLPVSTLLFNLSMVNRNYTVCRSLIPNLSDFLNINEKFIYEFYNNTHGTLRSNLETALNQLRRKSLIHWEKVKTICCQNVEVETTATGAIKIINNNEINYNIVKQYGIPATEKQIKIILKVERMILKKLGFKDKQEVLIKNKWNEFISSVNKILYETENILFYYDSYKIVFNKEDIQEEKYYLENDYREETKEKLNNKVIDKLETNINNRHEKSLKNINDLKERFDNAKLIKSNSKYIDKLRTEELYLVSQDELIKTLIDKNSDDIINKVQYIVKK